jgi:hypothetical protein
MRFAFLLAAMLVAFTGSARADSVPVYPKMWNALVHWKAGQDAPPLLWDFHCEYTERICEHYAQHLDSRSGFRVSELIDNVDRHTVVGHGVCYWDAGLQACYNLDNGRAWYQFEGAATVRGFLGTDRNSVPWAGCRPYTPACIVFE